MNDSSGSPLNPNSLDIFPSFKSIPHPSQDESKAIVDKPKNLKPPRQSNPSESNPFQCAICHIAVSSQIVYEEHIKGRRHQTQLQEALLNNPDYKTPTFDELNAKNQQPKTSVPKLPKQTVISSNEFFCDKCRVKCNSQRKLDLHIAGKKHQMKLRDQAFAKIDGSSNSNPSYTCNVCSCRCNTPKELQKHRLKSHSMRKNQEADRCDEAERKKQINFDDYRIPMANSKVDRSQYECKICQRKFREKIHVLGHIASAFHIEQTSRIHQNPLPEKEENPFFTSRKRPYPSDNTYYPPTSNPTTDTYDQVPSKRPHLLCNPDYSNSYEERSTDYSWNNGQYYPTAADNYHNQSSWQYQSESYYNPTANYNQSNHFLSKDPFLPNYDSRPSSYSTYPY